MDMRTTWVALAALALPLALCVGNGGAQTSEQVWRDMQKEMEALKEGQKGIQKELQEIKTLLLRARPSADAPRDDTPPNLALSLDGVPVKGEKGAKLVLVDFTDYQ
jgi:hypothetical protein